MARRKKKFGNLGGIRDLNFTPPPIQLSPEAKRAILIITLLTLGIITLLSLINLAGTLGIYLNSFLKLGFGASRWYVPVALLVVGYFLLRPNKYGFKTSNFFGLIIFVLSFNALVHIIWHQPELLEAAKTGLGGGYVGLVLAWPFLKIMGFWASSVVLLALAVIGLLLLFEVSLSSLPGKSEQVKSFWQNYNQSKSARKVRKIQEKREKEATREIEVSKVIESASEEPEFFRYQVDVEQAGVGKKIGKELSEEEKEAKQLDLGVGKFKRAKIDLPLSLLDGKTTIPDGGDIKANKLIIQKTLDNFGIASEMGDAQVGPTVTQYTLKPAEGIKLSRITALGDNLALALAAHPIRIEAPIPGRSLVGIEVPNEATAIVPLVDILISEQFKNRKSNLAIALGKDVMGRPWLAELDKMPHLLIAGATGSGKSVCINAVIISLLYQNGPGDLKFIMVDPKRVELPIYNGIPHLLTPVITDVKKTVNALRWAIVEMERRFDTLSQAHQRNIASFNAASPEKMPYIVVIIDELADLMAAAGPEVEAAIVRL